MVNELSACRGLDGRNASVTDDVQKVLGRKAKDFKEYLDETIATGVWNQV